MLPVARQLLPSSDGTTAKVKEMSHLERNSSGTWTRFSIEANANVPGTYLLTVPLANTVNQRQRLLSNGRTDFSTSNNTGINPSFVFTEAN